GEAGLGVGAVAGAGALPGLEDQDHGVVQRAAPRVAFAVGVMLRAAVLAAGRAELAEGEAVAAGLGQEVAAETEHVRPLAQLLAARRRAAEPPGGRDHLPVVRRAGQRLDVSGVPE